MLGLKTDNLYNSEKEDKGKISLVLQVLGMNEDMWDRAHGFGNKT